MRLCNETQDSMFWMLLQNFRICIPLLQLLQMTTLAKGADLSPLIIQIQSIADTGMMREYTLLFLYEV